MGLLWIDFSLGGYYLLIHLCGPICFVFSDYNATATYNEIKGLLLRGVDRANEVFSGAEFYGRGTKIHKGISFKLAAYHIDTDQVKIVARLGHQNLYFGLVNSNLFF